MRLDEKIAMLDRMRRIKAQEEREEEQVEKKKLTIEEAREGIQNKKIELEDGLVLEFDIKPYFKEELPFVIFKNFYQASQEEESGFILVNRDKNVSQIVTWGEEQRQANTVDQWANLLVNGMAANRMYANITKKVSLHFLEYICFEVPAKDSSVWNILFRFKEQWLGFAGNYNCMQQDVDKYGLFLEAMVIELDHWMQQKKGVEQDGVEERSDNV